MNAPDTVTLLGEHTGWTSLNILEPFGVEWLDRCDCGHDLRLSLEGGDPDANHRAHLAAVLDAHYAKRERAARTEAVVEAAEALRRYADGFVGPFHADQWREAAAYIAVRTRVGIPGRTDKETTE